MTKRTVVPVAVAACESVMVPEPFAATVVPAAMPVPLTVMPTEIAAVLEIAVTEVLPEVVVRSNLSELSSPQRDQLQTPSRDQ